MASYCTPVVATGYACGWTRTNVPGIARLKASRGDGRRMQSALQFPGANLTGKTIL